MRRQAYLMLFFFCCSGVAHGQWLYRDYSPGFFVGLGVRSGYIAQQVSFAPLSAGYLNVINPKAGQINTSQNNTLAFDLSFGYYLGQKRNWGIASGLTVITQRANLQSDPFHVEYQATDFQGNIYRQLITCGAGMTEAVKTSNINLPILLMYKHKIAEDFFISIRGGIMLNLQVQNKYTANASFDYEAIYKYSGSGNNVQGVYDNAAVPDTKDWIITADAVSRKNPTGDVQRYFDGLNSLGYNVGLDKSVSQSGTVGYSGSMGYVFQPGIEHHVKNNIYVDAGLYFISQSFSNSAASDSQPVTDKIGDYNSLLNKIKAMKNTYYGLSLGVKVYF